ncbi:BatD family protein [Winogradskyella costae]|uniref:BatD family protein n=1 Tax=Winogradskyella costae TaxID=2697008 RepID=UPI0015C90865|nr:BatD family protein [Winogradskyella costae]
MKSIKNILIIFLVLATSIASAQVKFEAKVSKKKLGINERLRIDFEMNEDGDNFVPPSFADFDVVGGPNTSVSNYSRNGKRSYSKTYSYFLAPKSRGNFTIKQATIEIEGETYKTFPITVNVTAAVSAPNGEATASDVASANIHLVAEVSKANPYLNEAITVVYKLYVSKDTGVSSWREKDTPRFNDFWSQNIDVKGFPVHTGEYDGEEYRYVILRKTVLYPQKTGALKLEPLVMEVTVEVPSNRRDVFGRALITRVPKMVTAGSRTINVKELPEEGKPSDFKGAVGDFDFKVTTSKTQLNATESLQAKIEVSGSGNLKLFELPKLTVPSSLEVYEPEHQENVRTNLSGMQGRISDTYTIVPQYRGKYPVPTISFSYFDLKTESYKRISSDDVVIDVLEGPMAANAAVDNTVDATKQTVNASTNTFAFIKTNSNWIPVKSEPFFKSIGFWSLLLVPFLAIPLAIVVRRKKDERDADVQGNRIRKADRLAKKYLSEAKKALGQKESFYLALEKALHNYLKAKLNIETSDFNKDKIESLLSERQVSKEVVSDFISILENCELARYTPITQVTMQNDYDKAGHTISLIDKQLR